MKQVLYSLFTLVFLAGFTPVAHAGVKIGAGDIPLAATAPKPTKQAPQEKAEPKEKELPLRLHQKAGPLARSTAELFRADATALKTAIIEKSLANVPLIERAKFRKGLEKELSVDKILNLYGLTLEQYYTEAELKSLRTFMADPTNRSMLEKLPNVLDQMGMDRQQYLNAVLEDYLQRELFDKLQKGEETILTPQGSK